VSPLIDDIQEELRREDFFNTLKKRLPWFIGAVAAILMGAAGYTLMQSRAEKNLVLYESIYEQAMEKIEQKDAPAAIKLLQDVAGQCPGLEFLALMTLANIKKTMLIEMTAPQTDSSGEKVAEPSGGADPQKVLDARKNLAETDWRILSRFSDSELLQFLSLCRLMLDVQQPWSYFGPSPLIRYHDSSKKDTVPVPLSAQDITNTLNVFNTIPLWSDLSMAVSALEYPKDSPEQHTVLKEWTQRSKIRIPLMTLLGLTKDLHR